MALETYTLWLFLAGLGGGVGIAIIVSLSRDVPWIIRRLYRFTRYKERPRADDIPPSLKADYDAILRDLERQGRFLPPSA